MKNVSVFIVGAFAAFAVVHGADTLQYLNVGPVETGTREVYELSLKNRPEQEDTYYSYGPLYATLDSQANLARTKRQHRNRFGFGGSASAANAQSQGFQVPGPYGFGASASQAGTQGFSYGPNGFSGSAGLSGSQTYNFGGGYGASVSYSNGFAVGPGGPSRSNGASVTFTGPNGPIRTFNG